MAKWGSYLHHPPLLFGSVSTHSLLRLIALFFHHHVLALLALAVLPAFETRLIALAVFLETVWFFAVAALDVLVILNFLSKGIGIPVHEWHYGVVSFFLIDVQIVTSDAVTPVAGLVQPKAVAVELQTFSFLAIADNFFVPTLFHCAWATSPLRVPTCFCFVVALKMLLFRKRSLAFRVLLRWLLGVSFKFAAAISFLHFVRTVQLAWVVLGILVWGLEDDAILDSILHRVILLIERQFVILSGYGSLHVPHFAAKNEIWLIPTQLRIGREGQGRKIDQKTLLVLALRFFNGCFGREDWVTTHRTRLCWQSE